MTISAFHIVTSIHDSRTSQRMIDYKVRQRRFFGIRPYPLVFPLTAEEEVLIAETVAGLVEELGLVITAFNLCRDHMHMVLVCEPEEVPKIMHRIKGRTARACNAYRANKGINPLDRTLLKDKSTAFWTQKFGCKPIRSARQYRNTTRYILNNRMKHNLPENLKLQSVITKFIRSIS